MLPASGEKCQRRASPRWKARSQQMGAHLDRQTACHFAHGGQEGEAAVGGLHRLIGNGGDLLLQKGLSLSGIGGEMQVRKEGLPFPQEAVLRLQRLFHLDDHIGSIKNGFGKSRFSDCIAAGGVIFGIFVVKYVTEKVDIRQPSGVARLGGENKEYKQGCNRY